MTLKIGNGFDVHAFCEGRDLILGGVKFEHERGLLGHSDADVLTHAIMDALLGAARLGDIGKLFPDTSAEFKDANSIELLKIVGERIKGAGFEIVDIDSTVMAQEPKISPRREEMRCLIARALDIDVKQVGVKATTTEGLGFVGRLEGIAASATALLEEK